MWPGLRPTSVPSFAQKVAVTVTTTFKSGGDGGDTSHTKLECGQMPNVMVTLPNTGGALCSTLQSLADAHYWSAVQ